MKTKLSKKLLSALLAVMLVITSVPLTAFNVFAAEDDAAVTEVKTAMTAFESKLASEGAFVNVPEAYTAYVDAQKALDAYTYGGEKDALNGVAKALTDAVNAIAPFAVPGVKEHVPLFANSAESDMAEYENEGYNNILFSSEAVAQTEARNDWGTTHKVYYSSDTVVFYDGKSEILIPIMVSANRNTDGKSYGASNWLWSAFPGNRDGDNKDGWYLAQMWNQGDAGNDSNMNWNWNWWSGKPTEQGGGGVNYHAAYNFENGKEGVYSETMRSAGLPAQSRSGPVWAYKYTEGNPTFLSNVLSFKGTPADYGQSYNIDWYVTTGGNGNYDETVATSANPIYVVNYKTIVEALMRNGNKMKDVLLSDYAEGGLEDYMYAMEDMAQFDPNLFFTRVATGLEGYEKCVAEMKTLVAAADGADITKKDSADYDALRNAMEEVVRKAYEGGQSGYTDDSWNNFKAKYEAAQAIMADVNNSGYTSSEAAAAASELDAAYKALQTKVAKVDASSLVEAIDRILDYDATAFTAETLNPVTEVINAAKAAVWGKADDYKVPSAALDDSAEAQKTVADNLAKVLEAEKTLRLSMDFVVATGNGRYSVNSASALLDTIKNPTDYANFVAFETAINNAADYAHKAELVDLTDYAKQVEEYTTYVKDIADAYVNLQYSFTKIPDGTVANVGNMVAMQTLKAKDQGEQFFDFSYTSEAVILKTTKQAQKVTYGKADMAFGVSVNNGGCDNNMLDSITINAVTSGGAPGDQNHINSNGPFQGSPNALTDDQKNREYAGCLTNQQFSLSNIKYSGKSYNNANPNLAVLSDGTAINDQAQLLAMDLTEMIGTTDGAAANPARGGVFTRSNNDVRADINLTSDISIDIPSKTAEDPLKATSGAKKDVYDVSGALGVVSVWNVMNTSEWCGYNWLNSHSQYGEVINFKANVVDMSNLVAMVDLANKELVNSSKYTPDSWAEFTKYLEAAQMPLDYKTMTADQIRAQCHKRYSELKTAYKALQDNIIPITFTYKNAEGQAAQQVIEVQYGYKLSQYKSQVDKVKPANYNEGNYTYSWTGEWNPVLDMEAPVGIALTYDAVYEQSLNMAKFENYNIAKTELLNALADEKLSADSLDAAAALLTDLKYFDYTEEQQNQETAASQSAIDNETEVLKNAKAALVTVTYDTSVAEALKKELEITSKNDPDMYDNTLQFEYLRSVEIVGKTVKGLIYASQDALNAAIKASVEGMQPKEYHIYFNGSDLGTAPYGTSVVIDSEGKLTLNADNADGSLDGTKKLAWSYSYSAPSNENNQTAPKFICTANAYGFVVKGDTYVTTENAESTDNNYVVTIYSSVNNRVVDVINTTGTFNMPSPYTYPFYRFTGYSNGVAAGAEVTVDKNTSIVANYEPVKADTFQVDYFKGYEGWTSGSPTTSAFYNYNKLVEFSDPDAYCWVKAKIVDKDKFTAECEILAFGTEYSFYACEDLGDEKAFSGVVSITKAQYEGLQHRDDDRNADNVDSTIVGTADYLVDGSGARINADGNSILGYTYKYNPVVSQIKTPMPVYADDNNTVAKFTLIGRVAIPEGYTVLETGFMFSTDPKETNFDVDNANNKTLFRYKTSKITSGNQFAVNIINPSTSVSYQYAAYAIVKDAEGNVSTHYTSPVLGDNQF